MTNSNINPESLGCESEDFAQKLPTMTDIELSDWIQNDERKELFALRQFPCTDFAWYDRSKFINEMNWVLLKEATRRWLILTDKNETT